jgi:hypothetical protein
MHMNDEEIRTILLNLPVSVSALLSPEGMARKSSVPPWLICE